MLEFTRLYLCVPRRYVGRLIGRQTSNILSIIEKSGVIHIHFDDHIEGPTPADVEDVLNMDRLSLEQQPHSSSTSPSMKRIFLKVSCAILSVTGSG